MIEEKDEMAGGLGRAANDQDGRPDEIADAELPDEGIAETAEDRLAAVEAELAETENVRRRMQRERDDAQKFAAGAFAKDLLSPVDNLRRALDAMPESELSDPRAKSLRDGVAATERELLTAFERHGLKRIDPKGEPFDHNFHQAVFEAERPDVPAGTVVEVLQPGYVQHDRLLRPAMVGVAKGGARAQPKTGGDAAA